MPNSVTSTKNVPNTGAALGAVIARSANLGELLGHVPAPYHARTTALVNTVYRASVKFNHVRSYLSTLEKHKVQDTFPPEIGGRILDPTLQVSKEYAASSQWASRKAQIDKATVDARRAALDLAIAAKQEEASILQELMSESSWKTSAQCIFDEVSAELTDSAGVPRTTDGSVDFNNLPDWIKLDATVYSNYKDTFCQRALALAFARVQEENASKMKSLSLKRKTDQDIEMQDIGAQRQTVSQLVAKEVERALREQKPSQNSTAPTPSQDKSSSANYSRRKRRKTQDLSPSQPVQGLEGQWQRQEEREGGQEQEGAGIWQQVRALERCLGACPRAVAVTVPRRRSRIRGNTNDACTMLDRHGGLFADVSGYARRLWVSSHTPVGLFELGHSPLEGVFKGQGVTLPRTVEYQIALNAKFILHHSPRLLRVHEAWQQLQRSVRLRWHFRDSLKAPSKFYVPKRTWQPPPKDWNLIIEAGLRKGKDLLLSQASALPPSEVHRSNPDLRLLKSFLQSSDLLVKPTDKNLGIAVLARSWYHTEMSRMLEDSSTYNPLLYGDLEWYHCQAVSHIERICRESSFPKNLEEFLLASKDDAATPQFHGIPKVHGSMWKLRPIVPSHSWVTSRSSKVCDAAMRPLLKNQYPWCVDSSRDVILAVQKANLYRASDIWLVTGDVTAFYTNVNVHDTISRVVSEIGPFMGIEDLTPSMLGNLLHVVMGSNCFEYDEKHFHQVAGVAMGTACAPVFANLNLAFMEAPLVMESKADACLKLYLRYIDDIFLVYQGSKSALDDKLEEISSRLKPFTIQWNICSSSEACSFLDIEFSFHWGFGPLGLQSKVHRKKMNKHQYIPFSSAHPQAVKKAFVKAELTRFCMLSSTKEAFEDKASEFMQALSRRGYPVDVLRRWWMQVCYEDRLRILSKRKVQGQGLPLMLPSSYDEIWEYVDVKQVLQTMWTEWAKLKDPVPASLSGPLLKSLRRTENLFDKFSAWNKTVLHGAAAPGVWDDTVVKGYPA